MVENTPEIGAAGEFRYRLTPQFFSTLSFLFPPSGIFYSVLNFPRFLALIKKGCEEKKIGLILTTSIFALPLALAAFPQRQAVAASSLESEFWDKAGEDGMVEFNRGI